MVALFTSLIALVVGVGLVVLYGMRRPADRPLTWGEAMVGAVLVFGILFLAYGVVPHQFIDYADKQSWRSDSYGVPWPFTKDHTVLEKGISFWPGGRGRILITKEAVRDALAAGIYIVFLGGQIALWSFWQKRGKKKPKSELVTTSAFGRPLVKKA